MDDKKSVIISLTGILIACFMFGVLTAEFRIFPYSVLKGLIRSTHMIVDTYKFTYAPRNRGMWHDNKYGDKAGVIKYDTEKAQNGLTLFTSTHEPVIRLIDMEGGTVHEWAMKAAKGIATGYFYGEPYLYPNGDILAMHSVRMTRKQGKDRSKYVGGLVKMDKDGNIIWDYSKAAHHDVEVGRDGTIYTLLHVISEKDFPRTAHWGKPLTEDSVAVIDPEGKVLKIISLPEAFLKSEKFSAIADYITTDRRLDIRYTNWFKGDILHTNALRIVGKDWASHYPNVKQGQIFLSFREIDAIAVLDPESEEIVWAQHGFWRAQHDPEMLKNGNVLMFDNEGRRGKTGHSRIIEYNPTTTEYVWTYEGTEDEPFDSYIQGSQSILKNGNILVTDTMSGRIFEVTRDKAIVWEYINPARRGKNYIGVIHGAQRFDKSDLPFLNE